MLDRTPGWSILAEGPEVVFESALAELLRSADVTLGNLESPISDIGAPVDKSYTFRAPPGSAKALALAGFDLVSLANNHALDYGPEAMLDTVSLLAREGVRSTGAGEDAEAALAPWVIERNGLRVAVVGLVDAPAESDFRRSNWEALPDRPGVAWADAETVAAAISRADAEADIVVVLLHFGNEFQRTPSESQRELARAAIDAGATLVVGSHPHVLQEVEEYGGGLIAYSLGNFVFDGFPAASNETAILRVTLSTDGITGWELVPVTIDWRGLPRLDGDD